MVIQKPPIARDRARVLRERQARRQREVLVVLRRDVEVVLVERYPAPHRPYISAIRATDGQRNVERGTGGGRVKENSQLREGAVDVEDGAAGGVLDDHEHLAVAVLELEALDGRERRERARRVRVRAQRAVLRVPALREGGQVREQDRDRVRDRRRGRGRWRWGRGGRRGGEVRGDRAAAGLV